MTPLSNGIRLEFNGFLRVTSTVCEQPNDPGQWLTISNQTELVLSAQESVATPQLDQLTNALVVQRAFYTPPHIVFVLPAKWNTTTLSSAAQIAARLGKGISGKKPTFEMVSASGLTTEMKNNANFIFIGKPNEWPSVLNLPVSQPKATPSATPAKGLVLTPTPTLPVPTLPPNISYLRIINSPWNPSRKILLISASTDADLAQIDTIFADDAHFALLHGSALSLDTLASGAVNPARPSPWLSTNFTFAQLGESDRLISGTDPQNTYYELRLPDGWLLEPGAQLNLNLVGSPALTSEVSHVDVYANNILIGAIADLRDGKEQQVTLTLPTDRLQGEPGSRHTQNIELRLSVFNSLILAQCQAPTSTGVAWTRINATSSINVPHRYMALPNLQAFPYPFLNDKENIPVAIVLPTTPGNAIIGDALTLASMLGNRAITEFDVSIVTADQVTQDKYANTNLILLGAKNDQPLFDKFTQSLAASKSASVVAAFKNPDNGILYETASPWNPERMILMVASGTAVGYAHVFDWLVNNVPLVNSSGSIAVLELAQPPHVIYPVVTPTATSPGVNTTQQVGSTATPTSTGVAKPTEVATMASTPQQ